MGPLPLYDILSTANVGSGVLADYIQSAVTAKPNLLGVQVSEKTDSRSNLGLAAELQGQIIEAMFDGDVPLPESDVIKGAFRLISILPVDLPDPVIGLGPNGYIIFEWINTAKYRFAISVVNSSKFSFAGLYNHRSIYGSDFLRSQIEDSVVKGIQRAYSTK